MTCRPLGSVSVSNGIPSAAGRQPVQQSGQAGDDQAGNTASSTHNRLRDECSTYMKRCLSCTHHVCSNVAAAGRLLARKFEIASRLPHGILKLQQPRRTNNHGPRPRQSNRPTRNCPGEHSRLFSVTTATQCAPDCRLTLRITGFVQIGAALIGGGWWIFSDLRVSSGMPVFYYLGAILLLLPQLFLPASPSALASGQVIFSRWVLLGSQGTVLARNMRHHSLRRHFCSH